MLFGLSFNELVLLIPALVFSLCVDLPCRRENLELKKETSSSVHRSLIMR